MAAPTLCLFNKYGYCKYKETCRKHHVNEKCENVSFEVAMCRLRHPKFCKFYKNYGYCKFSPCAFNHKEETFVRESQKMETEMKALSDKMVALETIISEKNTQIQELSNKMSCLENKIKDSKDNDKLSSDKDDSIENTKDALNAFVRKNGSD